MLTSLSVLIIIFSSCHRYYMPSPVQGDVQPAVTRFSEESRHFVLRDSVFNYEMKNVHVDNQEIRGTLQRLPGLKKTSNLHRNRFHYYYKPSRKDSIVNNEVHIFTARTLTNGSNTEIAIPFSSVKQIEQVHFDKKKTTINHLVIGGVSVAAAASISLLVYAISIAQSIASWGD